MKFAKSGEVDLANTVNRAKADPSLQKMSVRHYDRVGVLLHVMKVMAEHKLCIQEMQNIVFANRDASVANITFSGELTDKAILLMKMKEHGDIIDVSL